MPLTKNDIYIAEDQKPEEVKVPEWGGSVFVKPMTGAERDDFESTLIADKSAGANNLNNIRARLAVRVLCDEAGTRLFADADADTLGKKNGRALDRVFEVAQRLSGIGDKEVKELSGN